MKESQSRERGSNRSSPCSASLSSTALRTPANDSSASHQGAEPQGYWSKVHEGGEAQGVLLSSSLHTCYKMCPSTRATKTFLSGQSIINEHAKHWGTRTQTPHRGGRRLKWWSHVMPIWTSDWQQSVGWDFIKIEWINTIEETHSMERVSHTLNVQMDTLK